MSRRVILKLIKSLKDKKKLFKGVKVKQNLDEG